MSKAHPTREERDCANILAIRTKYRTRIEAEVFEQFLNDLIMTGQLPEIDQVWVRPAIQGIIRGCVKEELEYRKRQYPHTVEYRGEKIRFARASIEKLKDNAKSDYKEFNVRWCRVCYKPFVNLNDRKIYCSHACKSKAHYWKGKERPLVSSICEICGKPIPRGERRSRYTCSDACRLKKSRRNKIISQAQILES